MDLRTIKNYELWLTDNYFDKETRDELKSIEGQEKEIEDRFYKDLEFGTAGIRGIIGAGTNRMNKYTIRKTTQGLANFIRKQGTEAMRRGVVIAYDSRHKAVEFTEEVALVLAANGIRVYAFDLLRPSPQLSFAVRYLKAIAGIVITASHNPAEYNGYKIYWEDGAQIASDIAKKIIAEIAELYDHHQINYICKEEATKMGFLSYVGEEIDIAYDARVLEQSIRKEEIAKAAEALRVVYTPLHGTGYRPVTRVLRRLGFTNVFVVPQQQEPNPDFPTVSYPNPEEPEAYSLAIALAKERSADIILATDPDCDRVGAVVKNIDGEYQMLTGNQTGALLVNYILASLKEKNKLPQDGAIIKTIVTSEMGRDIARHYGIKTIDTLTGFKYIGEKIKEFELTKESTFLFGYEESFGYLAGTYARDKDAVVAAMLICEMAAYYLKRGMTIYEGLLELYSCHGFYAEELKSITLKGKEGLEKIKGTLKDLRESRPKEIAGAEVLELEDYLAGISYDIQNHREGAISLPSSDVLKYKLEDSSWIAIRPSGTEPKLKIYAGVRVQQQEEGARRARALIEAMLERLGLK